MFKLRRLLLTLLIATSWISLNAQDNELKLGVRGGYNAVFGGFAAVSLETAQKFCEDFSISGGVQYNTIGRTALEARPSYIIDFNWGKLSPEILMSYTNISSVNSLAVGAGAQVNSKKVSGKLGYYYRLYGGHGSWINESFNIYYELSVHLLQKIENWKMDLTITNNEIFELERHYQPSFIAECFYHPASKLGISFGIGYKPAGMFNMSADRYQSFIKSGICYRW